MILTIIGSFRHKISILLLLLKKVVMGKTPDSDWEFEGSNPIGAFTIDKAGGEKTFDLPATSDVTITITKMAKSNFIVYGRGYEVGGGAPAFTMTHVVTIQASRAGGTWYWSAEFSNSYSPLLKTSASRYNPVGRLYTSVNKLLIITPYLVLAVATVVILSLTIINKKLGVT